MKTRLYQLCSLWFLMMMAGPGAWAQNNNAGWKFELAPFLWAANVSGEAGLGPINAPLDLDFQDDILENLDFVLTLNFEGKKDGKWGFLSQLTTMKLDPTTQTPAGPLNVDFKMDLIELGGTYTISRSSNSMIELLGGGRYTAMDLKINPVPPPLGGNPVDEAWWDAFFGARIRSNFGDSGKWGFIARADIGTGESDFVWNAAAHLTYRFNRTVTGLLGYRILDYDIENGSGPQRFAFNGDIQGVVAAVIFSWGSAAY